MTYLAALPVMYATCGTRIARLVSVGEIVVMDTATRASTSVNVDCEPALCALGPMHLAVGINNQVLFYRYDTLPGGVAAKLTQRRAYVGTVTDVQLTEAIAVVLLDGRVLVHAIEPDDSTKLSDQALPLSSSSLEAQLAADPITALAVNEHFIITGSTSGLLRYHSLQQGRIVILAEHCHSAGSIMRAVVQPHGTRLVFMDATHSIGLLNPLGDDFLPLPGFTGSLEQVHVCVCICHIFTHYTCRMIMMVMLSVHDALQLSAHPLFMTLLAKTAAFCTPHTTSALNSAAVGRGGPAHFCCIIIGGRTLGLCAYDPVHVRPEPGAPVLCDAGAGSCATGVGGCEGDELWLH